MCFPLCVEITRKNVLDTILSSQNGAAVAEISKSLGPGQSETQRRSVNCYPRRLVALVSNNASSQDGLGALLSALGKDGHQRYILLVVNR